MTGPYRYFLPKFLFIFAISSCLSYWAYTRLGSPRTGIDDANIFFVYAKHLAQGHGFVYNIGGEQVEGFTSMLWVLIAAFFFLLTDHPEALLWFFNIAIVSFALTVAVNFIDNSPPIQASSNSKKLTPLLSIWSLLFLGWVFSAPGYLLWTTLTLMETGLWSALLILCTICVLKQISAVETPPHTGLFSILLALLALTRPEAMLWGPVFIALFGFAVFVKTKSIKVSAKNLTLPVIVFFGTLCVLTVFRIAYFGYPLPNTYYAKISSSLGHNIETGFAYFFDFIESNFLLTIILAIVVLTLFAGIFFIARALRSTEQKRSTTQLDLYALSVILVIGLCIPIAVGGDHFGLFRFYQPLWPLLILPCLYFFGVLHQRFSPQFSHIFRAYKWPGHIIFLGLLLSFFVINEVKWHDFERTARIRHEFRIAKFGREQGRTLNHLLPADSLPRVGVITAGGIKYSYNGEVVDLMGLNNLAMAHHKEERKGFKNHASFSKAVFYRIAPQICLVRIEQIDQPFFLQSRDSFVNRILDGLLFEPQFTALYQFATIKKNDVNSDHYFDAFFRRDYLDSLRSSGDFIVDLPDEQMQQERKATQSGV